MTSFDNSTHSSGLSQAYERHQERLLKTGALQNAILTSANFSIIATDEKGIIQLFNIGAERMLGYLASEVVDKINPSDIHDPAEVMARAQALSLELSTTISPGFEALAFKASRGIEDIYELTYICKDGSRFPAIVSITALRDDYGDIIGYLLIGTDNSVRKQVELELKKAMGAAEKANLAKSDFLSSMSHELRTPLSAILGFAQLIESGQPEPTPLQQRSLDQILQAGWYLLDLINEILDLALIESGKLSLSLESVSLNELVFECEAMMMDKANKRGIQLTFPAIQGEGNTDFFVMADRTRMKQVIINLLSNAIKYNVKNGAVSVFCTDVGSGRVRMCVHDTGPGLTQAQVEQLFQPFNRLGRESSTEAGTGIGLVMTKRLVELMGGTIRALSRVGVGSEFIIEMDLIGQSNTSLRRPRKPIDMAHINLEAATDKATHTLLYVEDNPANLMLVEDLIARRSDIRLLTACDGLQGVALAQSTLPDVILMDINLPGISGLKALSLLVNDPATRHIPVIALSANAMKRDIEKGLEAGFFKYLTKPIRVPEFMQTMDDALQWAYKVKSL
jgi:PAS domain S-box-containing protein